MFKQRHRADTAACVMEVPQFAKISVDEIVAVDDEERRILKQIGGGFDPARRATQSVLKEIVPGIIWGR